VSARSTPLPAAPPVPVGFPRALLRRARDFSGFGDSPGLLWPRWLLLRGAGLVFVVIFAGILVEGPALIGPHGISPVADFCAYLQKLFPNPAERLLRAPSLFWLIGTGSGAIAFLSWTGAIAAAALTLNLWPRASLLTCWAVLLSFVSTWGIFTASINDQLMLELALLAVPFAPAGFRPGLGAASPPPAVAVFALRFLLLRVMLEAGLIKLLAADPHWRNLTAMDVLFQSSPAPTILGYYNSQLPHAFLVAQIGLTFAAEIVAPFAAMFGGRRWRWFAFLSWTLFQSGIQATINFGWLNTASIALGLVLLDDDMLAGLAGAIRFPWGRRPPRQTAPRPALRGWRARALQVAIGAQTAASVWIFVAAALGRTEFNVPRFASRPVEFLIRDFRSANAYIPFASFPDPKYEVEFGASADGGFTWSAYEFRIKPQREDRMSPFVAPWFSRFEAALQIAVYAQPQLIARVARQILLGNPDVIRLFRRNPFPDGPPTLLRVIVYKYTLVDWTTHRETGRFWHKEFAGDFITPLQRNADGTISPIAPER
jgi:hypothetical protein